MVSSLLIVYLQFFTLTLFLFSIFVSFLSSLCYSVQNCLFSFLRFPFLHFSKLIFSVPLSFFLHYSLTYSLPYCFFSFLQLEFLHFFALAVIHFSNPFTIIVHFFKVWKILVFMLIFCIFELFQTYWVYIAHLLRASKCACFLSYSCIRAFFTLFSVIMLTMLVHFLRDSDNAGFFLTFCIVELFHNSFLG